MEQCNKSIKKGKDVQTKKTFKNEYRRCGIKGHRLCNYCMSKHLVDLTKPLLGQKEKKLKQTSLMEIVNITCMDVSDFFEDLSGKKYHLIINIPMFVLI